MKTIINNIPTDLIVLSCKPYELTEQDLTRLIYDINWYSVSNVRSGNCVAVSESQLGEIFDNQGNKIELSLLEDSGFSLKDCEIEEIPMLEKRWNMNSFLS